MEKKIFVGLTALGLLALMVTSLFHLGNQKPLNGSWTKYQKPELCAEAWMDGSYQTDLENYTAANYSMHNFNVLTEGDPLLTSLTADERALRYITELGNRLES